MFITLMTLLACGDKEDTAATEDTAIEEPADEPATEPATEPASEPEDTAEVPEDTATE